MKKVIVFDLDDTIAASKSEMSDEMSKLLGELLEIYQVAVISGGKYGQFQKQLLSNLQVKHSLLENLHLLPTCGTRYYRYNGADREWKLMYAEDFNEEDKKKIISVLKDSAKELGIWEDETWGEIIEDRESQITFSALGQDIVEELGDEGLLRKQNWDPDDKKKRALRDLAAERLSDFEVRVGGKTSVDVTRPGIDKAYGMHKLIQELEVSKDEIFFVGDRLEEGGNDYPVKAMGIKCVDVEGFHETPLVTKTIVQFSK